MATLTRFNIPQPRRLGDLPTGYDSRFAPPSGITVPSCGLEDVDCAVFEAFDSGIGFQVAREGENPQRPSVVFASGERWAFIKKKKGVRDENGSLILPMITVNRTGFTQSPTEDVAGRGINQQTGELVVTRRLDASDRGAQALLNPLGLMNQQNAAVEPGRAAVGQLTSRNGVGSAALDSDVVRGAWLAADRRKAVFETITIPSPQFFTATYEVNMWAQYVTHINQMWERLVDSFLPQGNAIRIDVKDKGYWFVATVDGNAYTPDNNFDDMSDSERIVKHKFVLKVPAYRLAGSSPGAPVPVRRTVSSPFVSFGVEPGTNEADVSQDLIDDPYLGADDPTLPLDPSSRSRRRDGRRTGAGPLVSQLKISPIDPALEKVRRGSSLPKYVRVRTVDPATGRTGEQNVRVKSANPTSGETVFATPELNALGGLTIEIGRP